MVIALILIRIRIQVLLRVLVPPQVVIQVRLRAHLSAQNVPLPSQDHLKVLGPNQDHLKVLGLELESRQGAQFPVLLRRKRPRNRRVEKRKTIIIQICYHLVLERDSKLPKPLTIRAHTVKTVMIGVRNVQ